MKFGKFITFEGGEGSGKSTQSQLLGEYLNQNEIKTIVTREIGGTHIAEMIREIVLHQKMNLITELLLIMAARSEHIEKVIRPALTEGQWVICDRYIDSTACYQSNDNISQSKILELHLQLIQLMPDITFYLELNPNVGLKRAYERANTNKYEAKHIDFHRKIDSDFKQLVLDYPSRIKNIKITNQNVEQIHQKIVQIIKSYTV